MIDGSNIGMLVLSFSKRSIPRSRACVRARQAHQADQADQRP
jgi:hypothetical protein